MMLNYRRRFDALRDHGIELSLSNRRVNRVFTFFSNFETDSNRNDLSTRLTLVSVPSFFAKIAILIGQRNIKL